MRREEHGNELVQRAIEDGDQEIERKAAEDLDGTREEMLRREEEQRQREEQELRDQREREMTEAAEPELEHAGDARGVGRGTPAQGPGSRR